LTTFCKNVETADKVASEKSVRNNANMEETKYFIYARKSTKGDDRQVLSIPAQLQALERLAEEQNLFVIDRFIERESAHTPGRPHFKEMMQRVEAGEASGIIAWHPDRLARNSRDSGEIIYFLDTKKITDLKFSSFWFENTAQGKSNLGHELVQTKQYSDKLSQDTKRGQRHKAQSGFYPTKAPVGYLNDRATKKIVPDPGLAPIVKWVFERYAEGTVTVEALRLELAAKGLVSKPHKQWNYPGGRPLHSDFVFRLLRNPIYYGHFKYVGELYEGKHEPIITKELFDRVQEMLVARSHPQTPQKQPKAFTGLLRCGQCGMMITAEIQKGHVYYRCSRKSRKIKCSQPYTREEALDEQLASAIAECSMSRDLANYMLEQIAIEMRDSAQATRLLIEEKRNVLGELASKQQKLLETYISELIDRETFTTQKQKLLNEKKNLQEQIEACEADDKVWLEPFKQWVLTAQTLDKIAFTASPKEKKALALNIFGSNLTLVGKKARGKAVNPWSLLQNKSPLLDRVRAHDSARLKFTECLKDRRRLPRPHTCPGRGDTLAFLKREALHKY
jgi:DNA invertase Pin-like site-specific DNA recombinase